MPTVSIEELEDKLMRLFVKEGLNTTHAEQMTSGLLETSLKGIDTHGLRLLPLYIRELREGRSKANPNINIEQIAPSLASIDADSALGIIAGIEATEKCIEMCRETGIALVSVKNSNHFGAASIYGDQIAGQGMIAMVSSNAAPRVIPHNGSEKLFGTNPWCFTSPISEKKIFSLDMATSQVAYAKIKAKFSNNQPVPEGWCLGINSKTPKSLSEIMGLLPLGGYKGQGLNMMVQILTGLLAGSQLDYELTHLDEEPFDRGRCISHFFLAIDIGRLIDINQYYERMQEWIEVIKSSNPLDEVGVKIAGEIERETKEQRLKTGIPFTESQWQEISLIL